MIRAFFTVFDEERFVEIPNMDSVDNESEVLMVGGCMARMLGISIYDVTYKRFELISE